MKFNLLLLFGLVSKWVFCGDTIHGRHFSYAALIKANGSVVAATYNPGIDYLKASVSDSFWIKNIYVVNSIQNENSVGLEPDGRIGSIYNYLSCTIYIQPGDSVTIIDTPGLLNQTFYYPDTIHETENSSEACGEVSLQNSFTIIIQYLSGPMEQFYLDSILSIQQVQPKEQITICPNPTTGLLNFTNYYPNNGTPGVEIFDVSGREVLRQSFEVSPGLQTNPIDMSKLPNGVYLVQYTVNGARRMEKVVKM